MGYKITKKSYRSKNYVWNAEAEVLIALLTNKLIELNPDKNWNSTCRVLNGFLKKKINSQCNPTNIQTQLKNDNKNGI